VPSRHAEEFARLVAAPEPALDLAAAALAIARGDYPGLEAAGYLRRLDELAQAVRGRLEPAHASPLDLVRALNRYLFAEQGFAGNAREYYDPRNSFLNEVLDRRLGIPVTLAVVYLEVGWRLGLGLEGVAFPGHFLVKLPLAAGALVLDPYHRGAALGAPELAERVRALGAAQSDTQTLLPRVLVAASKRQILARMLGNLRAIYGHRGDPARLIHVLSLLLVLQPGEVSAVRDRARAYQAIGNSHAAAADWRRYLESLPDGDEASRVRTLVVELEERPGYLH
jgi:regulator of sirC expression with transglutaminase-like and TPR domain